MATLQNNNTVLSATIFYPFKKKKPSYYKTGDCKEFYSPPFQRVDKPIDTLAGIEKEGKFVEHELVGVRGYGRGRALRKQAEIG